MLTFPALAWSVDAMGYVNVHVDWGVVGWGGVGHVNVHVHSRGMLMLWVMLTFM